MSLAISSPMLPPPLVPPDLLFLHPSSDLESVAPAYARCRSPSAPVFEKSPPPPLARSRSLPAYHHSRSENSSSLAWVKVSKRSEPKAKDPPSPQRSPVLVTNSKFDEEEEVISTAQRILRARLNAVGTSIPDTSTAMSRKHARRKIREQLYILSTSDTGDGASFSTAGSAKNNNFGLASDEPVLSRRDHSQEA
ncbi:unnamed protein product [Eruca vesicaria subsp. sativa]|uniref:Uncharacterized protein n=1 Tax=Eruca vesicaria subsp. sativa TaxID=29727 RepID=A0ABC8JTS4_ERUVS|nr:unnamed protein product [Eruca vesicaria subsp. sativa]